ncbi:unnamed protein product, partial [Iphiclides podalirius]
MDRITILFISPLLIISTIQPPASSADGSVLSAVLTPSAEGPLQRQQRSYEYYERYGSRRPLYERPDYGGSCGRCDDRYDDRSDDSDEYDRGRDKYDEDRRPSHRPTTGGRHDKKDYDDDRRYSTDRKSTQKNETDEDSDSSKRPYDDKDRHSGGRRGHRDRDRDRNRHDDRDRYRPDYYDRFLRDPYRDRYERPYYEDPYRERRPYDRYPDRYDDGYSRYDGYGYTGYRRPYYDDRYDRGGAYDPYGGYGPSVGRGQHDRPWDETYRGQAGWDAGGRGYYFASGRPETSSQYWPRQEYARPQSTGWQGAGYSSGYRDPVADYRGSFGYAQTGGYRQDLGSGYGQSSGWHSVGERRPYRDQSGVSQLDNSNDGKYGQNDNRQPVYGQYSNNQAGLNIYGSSSTTPGTSYLYEREDDIVTDKPADDSSKAPS